MKSSSEETGRGVIGCEGWAEPQHARSVSPGLWSERGKKVQSVQ